MKPEIRGNASQPMRGPPQIRRIHAIGTVIDSVDCANQIATSHLFAAQCDARTNRI